MAAAVSPDMFVEALDVHISFEFLPVHQQAIILEAINNTYERLLVPRRYPAFRVERRISFALARRLVGVNWPPLCIDSINTGNSIDLKFKPAGQYLPSLVYTKQGDLEIWLPRYSAAVILTGIVLGWGLTTGDDVLEFYEEHIQTREPTQMEGVGPGVEDRYENFKTGLHDLKIDGFRDPTTFGGQQLATYRRRFRRQMHQENIHSINIFGLPIDESDEE